MHNSQSKTMLHIARIVHSTEFNQVHQQPFDQLQHLQKNILVCIQYVSSMHVLNSNHSLIIYTMYKY